MSADNYLAIRYDGADWTVNDGNASTGNENVRRHYKTRDEAIDAAQNILDTEMVEYGISAVDRVPALNQEKTE